MRLAVYTDYAYHRAGREVHAERAFALFLARLAPRFKRFAVIGRLSPQPGRARYPLGEGVQLVALPYYPRLSEPLPVLKGIAGSLRRFWTALADTDCVLLFGPHPLAFCFAATAWLRRRRVVLGVRQDLPEYVRNRHPGRRLLVLSAWLMEQGFRAMGRFFPVIAVGPTLADRYRHSRRLLQLTVSLVEESDIVAPEARRDDYRGELKVLSVGRLDPEKNPLMLADVLARLLAEEDRWRLIICGEGSLAGALGSRLRELGVDGKAELRGYVSQDDGLRALYGQCQMLLHVSWTEGLPQVLYEAFAAGLPVVATDVGGVGEATAGAVSLVAPGDPEAAAQALRELSEDEPLRLRRVEAGHALVTGSTIEQECRRVAEFLTAR
jgi:glycosyltransferase involved in cell wall biosynthesis